MHSAKDSLMACRLNDFLSANRLETTRYQFCFEARVIGLVRLRARGSCRVRSWVPFSNPASKLCIFATDHIMVCSNIYLRFQQFTGSAFNFFRREDYCFRKQHTNIALSTNTACYRFAGREIVTFCYKSPEIALGFGVTFLYIRAPARQYSLMPPGSNRA